MAYQRTLNLGVNKESFSLEFLFYHGRIFRNTSIDLLFIGDVLLTAAFLMIAPKPKIWQNLTGRSHFAAKQGSLKMQASIGLLLSKASL